MSKLTIRVKMMLWFVLLSALLLAVFIPVLYQTVSVSLYDNLEELQENSLSQIIVDLESGNDLRETLNREVFLSPNIYAAIIDVDGNVIAKNNGLDWLGASPFYPNEARTVTSGDENWMVRDYTLEDGEDVIAYIRVASDLQAIEYALTDLKAIMAIAGPAFLVLSALGAWLISRRALKPISNITQTAQEIEASGLSTRINGVFGNDEVGKLAGTINTMLDRLEASFTREKRFASDASHELRTPIAVIMSNAEESLLNLKKGYDSKNLEKSLSTIFTESQKMNKIVSMLLMLTRGYENQYAVEMEKVDLRYIIHEVIEEMQPSAMENGIVLNHACGDDLVIYADQSLITQMLINLVHNSIKYGKKGGHVEIGARKVHGGVQVEVRDDGIGMPQNEIHNIFERFYRIDKSRDRSGSGLGLSIVKWIVKEHRGSIHVESVPGEGSCFRIFFPQNKSL
ncbi:MAG: HAMP domain-containing sensor histidine kinase [Christensenella sp.]|nr:HAMP domain-containing sensor histidine kinase [Christensenella sp.]